MVRFKQVAILASLGAALILTSGCTANRAASATTSGDLSAQGGAQDGETDGSQNPITSEELETLRANFERVHFDFDRAELDSESREVLAANAAILLDHPDVRVRVEGHADHWGSDIYNLALGQSRAEVVRRYLSDLGVRDNQIEVISYGEERPLVGDADRTAEAPNRRAEFLVITGDDAVTVESSY